ncbi:MAG TPA: LacI family DNA-binding transcriptional regulator [Acidothermaceae bacterium]|jgi:DNA-binding LacI/PurR family transcriptional regulator|nr:LacI family DNA-binding transcriptional regulator [Acidothermaceae bacterium]
MTDVARLAGVSHQTVSRVINKHPGVKPTTRMRVLAAIEALGYRRNSAARALATGRTRRLGAVTLNSTLYGPASTLYGIEQAALESQYSISVASLRSNDRPDVEQAIGRLVDQGVEGIVVIAPLLSVIDALSDLPTDLPVVAVEGDADGDVDVVTVDQTAGAQSATEHLLACGHETVWHLAGPTDWLEAQQRLAGWRATLERAGADVPPPLLGDWSPQSGFEAGRLLARMPEVKAVFVANDSMALGVLRALHEHGRPVPDDVSVVGFDDIPEAAYFTPPLTTVRQDFGEVGRRSLALLLDQVDSGPRAAKRLVVGTSLITRQSTAAERAA